MSVGGVAGSRELYSIAKTLPMRENTGNNTRRLNYLKLIKCLFYSKMEILSGPKTFRCSVSLYMTVTELMGMHFSKNNIFDNFLVLVVGNFSAHFQDFFSLLSVNECVRDVATHGFNTNYS